MRVRITLFIFLLATLVAHSQPQVSYMLPDLGTPNMNTYVEFIAPNTALGTFGSDGFFMNNPGETFRVRCANSADEQKIVVGPCVVSWNGRLISTQIFVKPSVIADQTNWAQTPHVIPLVVEMSGQVSAPQTFYIVKPTHIGDITGNPDRILGEGSLGRRSPRGAMIVDYIIFAGGNSTGTYTVSTADCDPNTPGNQGYLPFVLLATDSIKSSYNTFISVNANSKMGGPGGGGGGGQYNDVTTSLSYQGGSGYTGGGPGGSRNGSNRVAGGWGTGGAQVSYLYGISSLNNTPGGYCFDAAYESSGGGTGHPFGTSGAGCSNYETCDPVGAFGGGSGGGQGASSTGKPGGDGAYSSDGTITAAGRSVGNKMGVPLAGGSGGGSGNAVGLSYPITLGGASGYGGGGAGAIRISAPFLYSFEVDAIGAAGGIGVQENFMGYSVKSGDGGAGSGGFIELNAKDSFRLVSMNVNGGAASNSGRMRANYKFCGIEPIKTPNNTDNYYRGVSTKSYKSVARTFDLELSRDKYRRVNIYIKPESGNWVFATYLEQSPTAGVTNINISLGSNFDPDMLYYLVAVEQSTQVPSTGTYTMDPPRVMSQAAANILKIASPQIAVEHFEIHAPKCINTTNTPITKRISLRSTGTMDLTFDPAQFVLPNASTGFTFDFSTNNVVAPGNSFDIDVHFLNRNASNADELVETLYVAHNAPNMPNPVPIVLKVIFDIDPIKVMDRQLVAEITSLEMPKACFNSNTSIAYFKLKNVCDLPLTPRPIQFSNSSEYTVSMDLSVINPGESREVTVSFKPNSITSTGIDIFSCKIIECPAFDKRLNVSATVYNPTTDLPTKVELGNACIGGSANKTITFHNTSADDFNFAAGTFSNNVGFSANIITPGTIPPGGSGQIEFIYTPQSAGQKSTTYTLRSNPPCLLPEFNIDLEAGSKEFLTDFSNKNIVLPSLCLGVQYDTVLNITNTGTEAFTIDRTPSKIKSSNPNFVPAVLTTTEVPPGGTLQIGVYINTTTTGSQSATIQFEFIDCPNSGVEFTLETNVVTGDYAVSKNREFADVVIGETDVIVVTIKNNSTEEATLDQILPLSPPFSVVRTDPPSVTSLKHGESMDVYVAFTPTAVDEKTQTLDVRFTLGALACETSATAELKAKGVKSEIVISPNPIDFGIVAFCEGAQTRKLTVTNKSAAPFSLTKTPTIGGTNAALFSFSSLITYPHELKENESAEYTITFTPIQGEALGAKSADFTIYTNMTVIASLSVPLIATKDTVSLDVPSTISIGDIILGSNGQKTITVGNSQLRDAHIAYTSSSTTDILVDPNSTTVPRNGGTISVTANARGIGLGAHKETITFHVDQPCVTDFPAVVEYNVVEGEITADHEAKCDTVFYCETYADSVILYNPSKYPTQYSNVTFENGDELDFALEDPVPAIKILAAGERDTLRFTVALSAGELPGLKKTELVITTVLEKTPTIRIPLSVYFETFRTVPSPVVINLPARVIGTVQSTPVTLANSTGRLEKISSSAGVWYSAAYIGSDPVPDVPAWGKSSFNITYKYMEIGFKSDSVKVYFDSPCHDSVVVIINATGIDDSFDYSDAIAYGSVVNCKLSEKDLSVTNKNPRGANIEIVDMKIEGLDAAYFAFANPITYPVPISLGQTHNEPIRFTATNPPDGDKTAYVTITIRSNGKEYTVRSNISGTRVSPQYSLTPSVPLLYVDALVGQEILHPLEIRNTGALNIAISSLSFSDPDFYATNPPAAGYVLPAGTGTYTLQVGFRPSAHRQYSASLLLNCTSGDCPLPVTIALDGRTVEATSARISIASFDQVEPTERDFGIPIYVRLSDPAADISGLGFRVVLEYNATVYSAERASLGRISADSIFDKRRITTIEGSGVHLSANDSLLTTMIGSVLIGETDTTLFKVTNFEWTDKKDRISHTDADSGKLVVSICRAKDPRLFRNNGIGNTVLVNPNPAKQKINVHATCLETGEYSFELINLVGQSMVTKKLNVSTEGEHVFDFQIDAEEFSDGLYFLVMRTPARVKTTQVYISK